MAEIKPVYYVGETRMGITPLERHNPAAIPLCRHDEAMAEIERLRDALRHIANAYTAHGYHDAMDAVQALKDMAKEALDGNS